MTRVRGWTYTGLSLFKATQKQGGPELSTITGDADIIAAPCALCIQEGARLLCMQGISFD